MTKQRTLSILKPDAIEKNVIGDVIQRFEKNNLSVVAASMKLLTKEQAEGFYSVHKERPFFTDLVSYMTSGPLLVLVLEGDNAIDKNRQLMGATDPAKADAGTIRGDLASSIEENIVHGSDAEETALMEIAFFFDEICERSR
jgi:nucleoside-diphosphate kinase